MWVPRNVCFFSWGSSPAGHVFFSNKFMDPQSLGAIIPSCFVPFFFSMTWGRLVTRFLGHPKSDTQFPEKKVFPITSIESPQVQKLSPLRMTIWLFSNPNKSSYTLQENLFKVVVYMHTEKNSMPHKNWTSIHVLYLYQVYVEGSCVPGDPLNLGRKPATVRCQVLQRMKPKASGKNARVDAAKCWQSGGC